MIQYPEEVRKEAIKRIFNLYELIRSAPYPACKTICQMHRVWWDKDCRRQCPEKFKGENN